MAIKEEFNELLEKVKTQRDEVRLKIGLASLEAKEEIEMAEQQWLHIKAKASEIADETVETSEEYIAKAKIVGEELKDTYQRIVNRLPK
jgi:hypothetical protein